MVPLQAQDSPKEEVSYAKVHALFARHCLGCHDRKEEKGGLVLESYETLVKGGENGPVFTPGKGDESIIVLQLEHKKKPLMPPPKKGEKLKPEEVAVIKAWINAGAPAPKPGESLAVRPVVPKIAPKTAPRRAVHALAAEPRSKLVAVARYGEVELRSAETRAVVRTLAGMAGNVNALAFSADGATLAAAGGEAGVGGEISLWNVADGKLVRAIKGHRDAIYAVAMSPDGKLAATGSYDRLIILWDVATGKPVRELEGHNEAVFDLAFRKDGRVLASASGDRTVKLWDVATGKRLETLSESTKALNAVAWSPDGKVVVAGGVDNRVRLWDVSRDAKEGTNPLRVSQFVHEGAILNIVYSADGRTLLTSADDRTVKLWNAADFSPGAALEAQPDWPSALAFVQGDATVVVGRLDGSLGWYDAKSGAPVAVAKPEASKVEPRGVQRGTCVKVKVTGKNLLEMGGAKSHHPKLEVALVPEGGSADVAWATVCPARDLAPGAYEFSLWNGAGETARLKVFVDDLPQLTETESPAAAAVATPVSVWGVLVKAGDADSYAFDAKAGQAIVLDAAAGRVGSKADIVLALSDASGRHLAGTIDSEGEPDPLLVYTVPADGRYVARVSDLQMGGSADHVYRLSIGALPLVTGCSPLGVPANAETKVRLVGPNLPADAWVTVKAGAPGEAPVPVDLERYRVRRGLTVVVGAGPETIEAEPNDTPEKATPMTVPGAAEGTFARPGDLDLFRFEAKAGRAWVVETQAQQRGSPADTKIEVLHADGKPVPRLLLRAVRDSYLTFRPIDANSGGARLWQWEEMELNQYLYVQGEVMRLFLAPQGPDSEWKFYAPGGKRLCYFDTSATAHALEEPAYIVEPLPPGTKTAPNGLPVFPVYYANDDDPMRKLGSDSRLLFTPPADGTYLVRVRDVRGQGSDRHAYRLVVREARPDFTAAIEGLNANVPAGSGRGFTVRVERIDGFDGPVRVDIEGVPPGYVVSTPIVVEAGHYDAKGALWAAADAPKPSKENASAAKVTATATVAGKEVRRDLPGLGMIGLAEKPAVRVFLEPIGAGELVLAPGTEIKARLRIERTNFNDRVTFDVDNLPHGVIVGDIGLNGVLIPEKETQREIFLQCASWVSEADRPCFGKAREVGNPCSRPVVLHIRRSK